MGYNITLASVKRVEGFLNTLKNTKESVIGWRSSDAKQLQYQIHCGLKAAESIGVEEYKHLCKEWRIRQMGDKVMATRRDMTMSVSTAELLVDDVSDVYDIITNLVRHKDIMNVQPVVFKDVILDSNDIAKLRKYCDSNDLILQIQEGEIRVLRTS